MDLPVGCGKKRLSLRTISRAGPRRPGRGYAAAGFTSLYTNGFKPMGIPASHSRSKDQLHSINRRFN